jgi:APA family basic amino acid/polyamine antiporter
LARKLGLFDITMLVMGSVIGAGIFRVPHVVAAALPVPALVLAAWALGGVVTMAGCLVYAELVRRRPYVGGQYAFLREAYHPAVAFVYGWSLLWVIQSGGIASVAVVFAGYFNELTHLPGPVTERIVAAAAIALVTAINCAGVRTGSTVQNTFMVLKILVIATLVLCGWLVAAGPMLSDSPSATPAGSGAGSVSVQPAGWSLAIAFATAMVPVLFSYGGSHTTTFVAGEVRDARRNLPRGLVLGVTGVIVLYVAVNYVCLHALGVELLADQQTERPASDVMRRALGEPGAVFMAAGVAISALGFLSQATLTSPRVYYAMARDGLFLKAVARVHPRTQVPVLAVLLQGAFAIVIAVSRTFAEILQSVMTVEMTFYALTALGLFAIRRRDAGAADSARLSGWGHPWTTLLFAVVSAVLVVSVCYQSPLSSAVVIGIALAGLPLYFLWRYQSTRAALAEKSSATRGPGLD